MHKSPVGKGAWMGGIINVRQAQQRRSTRQ